MMSHPWGVGHSVLAGFGGVGLGSFARACEGGYEVQWKWGDWRWVVAGCGWEYDIHQHGEAEGTEIHGAGWPVLPALIAEVG